MHMQWLKEEFLPYLLDWEESVAKRKGYSKKEKAMMVLSNETRLGIQITGKDIANVLFEIIIMF